MNATEILFKEMLYNEECANFILNGWNCLYNDIVMGAGRGTWKELAPISAKALESWREYKEMH